MEVKALMLTCPHCSTQSVYRISSSYRLALKSYHDREMKCPSCGHMFFARKSELVLGVVDTKAQVA